MSESFEKLQNRILSDARVKAGDVIREAEEKATQTVETARSQAEQEAGSILAKARVDANSLRRSILSSKIRSSRLRLLVEKNRIVQSVLSAVEEKLSTISGTEVFQDTLKKMVSEAVDAVESDQLVVRVGFSEVSKKSLGSVDAILPKGAKLVIEEKPIDKLGGVVASDPQGRIVYNNSFRARMDRLDSQLLFLISSTIFGE
jgi:V/A-type H+/Na+-transporting ATPase subunit E